MPGAERERLIEEYFEALRKYSEAVSGLLHVEAADFDRAYEHVERLRAISERCREALENYE